MSEFLFQVLFVRRKCCFKLVRSTWGRINLSWNWWPKKCRSNQPIAYHLIIIFQHYFIYNSARLQPSIHTPPSVEAYGPVNHGALSGRILFLGSEQQTSRMTSHKYQNTASIITILMKADVQFVHAHVWLHAFKIFTALTQILSKRKHSVSVSELRNPCMLCSHIHKHTFTESQCLCQRGGSLFVYCLYTEKRETASIM